VRTLVAETSRAVKRGDGAVRRSNDGRRMLDDLLAVEPGIRREFMHGLSRPDLLQVFSAAQREYATPYGLYRDDCLGFVEDVLGENVWSISRQLLEAIPRHEKIAVPSCFSSSKSWSLSRATLWFSNVHPVGTARVVTLAPQWRQVSGIMWGAEIRGAHSRAGLPGHVGEVIYKIKNLEGVYQRVAEGMVGNPRSEASVQGLHAARVLVLVDEAGGIPHGVGRNLSALLTADGTQMVAIGNPPADNEGTWFEELCLRDDVLTIRISAFDTPNLTGEKVKRCRSCPNGVPAHTLAKHLVKAPFVEEIGREYGTDSPYYQAKVLARFPKGGAHRIIPSAWVDAAVDADEPPADGATVVRLCDLGLKDEVATWAVRRGAWVRLGVDVAADGGDELVIGRAVGDLGTVEHVSSGSANANPHAVAGVVLEEIRRAQRLRAALGTTAPVRVKIDGIGVGWGVAGILTAWHAEGLHDARIVVTVVSEATGRDPEPHQMLPLNKRAEMWISMRHLLQPGPHGEPGALRLRVDRKTAAQLSAPTYKPTSSGKTQIESKDSLRKRGLSSPDRGEGLMLAFYEPYVPEVDDTDLIIV
jgi:hypothetical protein